ncbi:MAG: LacI family transcriptional regulator, partial [Pseudonocardiales bacterium]|nr:LacI family transcriptional regulator [Pseudonocardiales bacterium]
MSARGRAPAGRQPTLHDVAAIAKVSVSTVSRYLNGQLPLRADTEARLLRAIGDVGYVRSDRKAPTAPPSTGVIGLVVPQIGNAQFGRIADAVVSAADGWGLSVLICSTLNHPRKQLDYVDLLSSRDVAGIVYAGNYRSNSALSKVISTGLPVVVIDEALTDSPPVDTVLVDDYAGAYLAVTYLINAGHRRIALVTGPAGLHSVNERTRAYLDV